MDFTLPPKDDEDRVYDEGWKAYEQGESVHDNPYRHEPLHSAWATGWEDAEYDESGGEE